MKWRRRRPAEPRAVLIARKMAYSDSGSIVVPDLLATMKGVWAGRRAFEDAVTVRRGGVEHVQTAVPSPSLSDYAHHERRERAAAHAEHHEIGGPSASASARALLGIRLAARVEAAQVQPRFCATSS